MQEIRKDFIIFDNNSSLMVSWIMAKNLDDCDSILKIFKKSDSEFS
ncbi:hypothetical protein LEP1GSC018_1269 [Leptospira kirschneri str. 2008720114]|nr:hypothetical protein LEP1GSC018_1269 [Leptospira kirschneri str. 2008720114]EMK07969.1 hypothetical protein LEP1GSC166_3991 [Leptospira kirschneri]